MKTGATKDVFFRSHVVELKPKTPLVSTYNEPLWPEYALVFDTETTLDPQRQSLLFGFYRVCQCRPAIPVGMTGMVASAVHF